MGRKPTPRSNYRHDAIVINRLLAAVEVDEVSPAEWKAEITETLNKAMRLFLEHAQLMAPKGPTKRKAG